MAITNDFLEFMNTTTCKKAIFYMTVLLFVALLVTEVTNRPSAIIQRLSELAFVFWIARATKTTKKR